MRNRLLHYTPPGKHGRNIFRVLFAALTLLVVGTYLLSAKYLWDTTNQDTQSSLTYINRILTQSTLTTLKSHELMLRALGEELLFLGADRDPERGRRTIDQMLKADPGMAGFGLARPDGQLILISGVPAGAALPNLTAQPESRDSFMDVLKTNELRTGRAYFMKTLQQWMIPIRVGIRGADGQVKLVMAAGYNIEGGTTTWSGQALPEGVTIAVMRKDGYIQYISPVTADVDYATVYDTRFPDQSINALWQGDSSGYGVIALPSRGGLYNVAFERLHDDELLALTLIPRSAVNKEWLASLQLPTLWLVSYLLISYILFRIAIDRQVRSDTYLQNSVALQQAIVNGANYSIIATDTHGTITAYNDAAEDMLGYTAEEVVGKHTLALFHLAEEVEARAAELNRKGIIAIEPGFDVFVYSARQGVPEQREWTYVRKGGSHLPVTLSVSAIRDNNGAVIGYLGIAYDITDRILAQNELMQRNENLRLVNELSSQIHGPHDIETIVNKVISTIITEYNEPGISIYLMDEDKDSLTRVAHHGIDPQYVKSERHIRLHGSVVGKSLLEKRVLVSADLAKDPATYGALLEQHKQQGIASAVYIPLYFGDSLLGGIVLTYKEPVNLDGEFISSINSIGNTVSIALINARHLEALEFQAGHDTLTGLANRHLLHQEFQRFVDNARDQPHQPTLLLIDLDRFKEINDTFGHQTGDRLLQMIGPRLQEMIGKGGLICRLGGDEFAVIIADAAGEIDAIAGKLLAAIRAPFIVDTVTLEIDASIGIARYPIDGKDSHELLRSADVAMYGAKQSNRGVMVYDSNLDFNTPERMALIADLNHAAQGEQFVLHYQPKLDLKTSRIIGFEALVRWQHPQRGLLYPDSFIAMAELSEAIHPMTDAIIKSAIRQAQAWQAAGQPYKIAINLSSRNLIDDRCLNNLKSLLESTQIDPALIELEITETMLMQDPEKAASILHRIAALGIEISVDDFGTGYSSLAYLHRLPINTLKIDRTFVKDMVTNTHDSMIVHSTIELAHNLGLAVVAEGVEDEVTLNLLKQMNCDQVQGYFVSRPQPPEAFTPQQLFAITQPTTHRAQA